MKRECFPKELAKVMVLKEVSQVGLTKAFERRGYRISKQFINQIATGRRSVPSLQLKRICDVLDLDDYQRVELGRAACRDQGYTV